MTSLLKHKTIEHWRELGQCIVFTNGCFDLLHPGHVHYLSQAAALGDRLVIGLNTDASVSRLKGSSRPILPLTARMTVLTALRVVDLVLPFEEDTPLRLIKEVHPDILVKGGDYDVDSIVGADFVQSYGGHVQALGFVPGLSTTDIISRIRSTS